MPKDSTYGVTAEQFYRYSYTNWNDGKTKVSPPQSFFSSARSSFEVSSLVVNPKQSDGFRTPSPFKGRTLVGAHKATVSIPEYSERRGWGVAHISYDGTLALSYRPEWFFEVETLESSMKNELRMRILNNIKDEVLDVAMVLAEMQGTVTTLVSNLGRVARSLDNIWKTKPDSFYYLMNGRRRDGRRPTDKFLRETAGTYLEWKYGIMPTVYDIAGATEALDINDKGTLWNSPPLMVARAGMEDLSVIDAFMSTPYWSNPECQLELRLQGSARADFSVSAEGLRGLSRYGIGLGTLGTLAFERTPFSFVLNMALPIAELIKAWTALSGGVTVRGYSETFWVQFRILKGSWPIHSGRGLMRWEDSPYKDISFKRNAGSTIPMPVPFIRNPLKVGNLATVLALFTQLRKAS